MSICEDGFGTYEGEYYGEYPKQCPCRVRGRFGTWRCSLLNGEAHRDTCPHAEALKAVAERPELKLVTVPERAERFIHAPGDGAILHTVTVMGYQWMKEGMYAWQKGEWEDH